MKKLIILFVTVSLFAACKNDKGKVSRDDRRTDRDDYRDKDEDSKDKDRNADYTDDREKEKDDKSTDNNRDKDYTVGGWPKVEKDAFIRECVSSAMNNGQSRTVSERYCDCMLEKMESLYPNINDAAKLTKEDVTRIMRKYKDGCLE